MIASSSDTASTVLAWLIGIGAVTAVLTGLVRGIKNGQATNQALGLDARSQGARQSPATRLTGFNYLGGHPTHAAASPKVTFIATATDIGVTDAAGALLFKMPKRTMQAIHIETEEEVRSRITATRLVLVGIFALAWKKKAGGSILVTFETESGPFVFEKQGSTKAQVMASLSREVAAVAAASWARTATAAVSAEQQPERMGDRSPDVSTALSPTGSSSTSPLPSSDEPLRPCPWCAELIRPAAVICRFCDRDLPPPIPS